MPNYDTVGIDLVTTQRIPRIDDTTVPLRVIQKTMPPHLTREQRDEILGLVMAYSAARKAGMDDASEQTLARLWRYLDDLVAS